MLAGERIKQLRIRSGYTQEELGNIIGIKKSAVSKYEKGLVTNLKRETIEKLAKLFDVSPSYILGITEEEKTIDSLLAEISSNATKSDADFMKLYVTLNASQKNLLIEMVKQLQRD